MNCLEAQALLSASHDGEPVDAAELKAAKAHCKQCPECSAFADGLRYLDTLPVAPAPEGLVERVMQAVAPLAAVRDEIRNIEADREQVAALGIELPAPEAEPATGEELTAPADPEMVQLPTKRLGGFSWFVGPVRWATYGAAAALAASALIAFVALGGLGAQNAATGGGAASTAAPLDLTYGAANNPPATAKAPEQAPTNPVPAQAPDYIVYNGFVYAPGALLADASAATPTIGTVSTAFASAGAPTSVNVFRSPLTDGSIVVASPDGMRLFGPVIRMLSSARYQLTSGKSIDRFGMWPTLPDRFTAPIDANGTPSFTPAGTDSAGVKIFAAVGHTATEGFAVAPGTAASDPAGGNPSWTWWLPAPANP